jgi:hypothetical protein
MRPESFRTITIKHGYIKNNKKYEANRKWLFLSRWATDRPWLQNDNKKGMTVEHYGDKLNLQGSSKKHNDYKFPKKMKTSHFFFNRTSGPIFMLFL